MHSQIKLLREQSGMTQAALAKVIKKSRSMIADYERNYARPPQPVLWEIARALNVSVDALYIDAPEEEPNCASTP